MPQVRTSVLRLTGVAPRPFGTVLLVLHEGDRDISLLVVETADMLLGVVLLMRFKGSYCLSDGGCTYKCSDFGAFCEGIHFLFASCVLCLDSPCFCPFLDIIVLCVCCRITAIYINYD